MELSTYVNLEPSILLGIANDKLRHECKDLHSLAAMMDVKEQTITSKLAKIGFHYEAELNQFRPDL